MSKELKVKEETALATTDLNSLFIADAGDALENLSQDDMAIPFLKLIQSVNADDLGIDGAKAGLFYNDATMELYDPTDGGIPFIPCAYQRRYLEWTPQGVGMAYPRKIYTPDEERPKTQRNEDNDDVIIGDPDGAYIEETHQHFIMVLGENGALIPMIAALKKTGLKKSRKFNTLVSTRSIMTSKGPVQPPRYSHIYLLRSHKESADKGNYYSWDFSVKGTIENTPEGVAMYGAAKNFAQSIDKGEVIVQHKKDGEESDNPDVETVNTDDIPF